jgi:hypothetical protein
LYSGRFEKSRRYPHTTSAGTAKTASATAVGGLSGVGTSTVCVVAGFGGNFRVPVQRDEADIEETDPAPGCRVDCTEMVY